MTERPKAETFGMLEVGGLFEHLTHHALFNVVRKQRLTICNHYLAPIENQFGQRHLDRAHISYDLHRYARLPFSCTHCGSCGDVCPVKVPLPELIFYWREVVVANRESLFSHDIEEGVMGEVLKNSTNLQHAERLGLWALRHTPSAIAESGLNPWAEWHRNPIPPEQTFREWYNENKSNLDETDK